MFKKEVWVPIKTNITENQLKKSVGEKKYLPFMVIVYKSRHGTYLYCVCVIG